jgi:hypothetical protein
MGCALWPLFRYPPCRPLQVPPEVLQHVAEGLLLAGEVASPSTPNEALHAWESRARTLLSEPLVVQRLQATQRPLEATCSDLRAAAATALGRAQRGEVAAELEGAGTGAEAGGVRWVGVAGFPTDAVQEAARAVLPAEETRKVRVAPPAVRLGALSAGWELVVS